MKRTVRIYRYTCDECGWEAFRAEIIPADLCSKCGNTKPPRISTEDKEFEFSADVEKAAEYTKRLQAGEDPEILGKEFEEKDYEIESMVSGLHRIVIGYLGSDERICDPTRAWFDKPVVY